MAYAYTVTKPAVRNGDAVTYEIAESEIGTSDEWVIPGLPQQVEITLFLADLTVAGSASTIQPELGYLSGWTSGAAGHIDDTASAAANVRNEATVKAYLPDGRLFGRSVPDTGTGASGRIVTRISIRPGHGA